MADFEVVDDAAFRDAAERGRRLMDLPRAVSARYDKRRRRVVVALSTGLEVAFVLDNVPGLVGQTTDDLAEICVEGVGHTLRFPRLDADYSVSRLLELFVGPMDWTRRQARAEASRANGRRGGRPRRTAGAG